MDTHDRIGFAGRDQDWSTWSKRVKWCRAWGEASGIACTGPSMPPKTFADGNHPVCVFTPWLSLYCSSFQISSARCHED